MSKFATKVASVVLTATTVISLSGFGSFAGVASAQTMDIASLMAQIQALQAQLAALSSMPATNSACTFTRNLMVGVKGADVTCLQNAIGVSPATGYFGPITKAKVMAWQSSKGVSATGYFGPLSRAAFGQTAMPTTPTTPTTPVYNTSGGLWVAAGAGAPTGSIIAGAGQVAASRVSFTAPATTGVTISGLTFQKVGVVSDSNISNLYLADVGTGAIVAQYQSLTMGTATFSNLVLNIAAGQTWWGELRADISTNASAGNSIAFDLTGVTTVGNVAVGGLPVKGNLLTVSTVSNPSIASIALVETTNAAATTVDAGTNSVLVSAWTTTVQNSAVNLRSMQFSFVGSANPADIRNLRLLVNGTQVASLPNASTETVFSMVANPARLTTGTATIQVFADVAGSPNRTFRLSLLQPYKVNAVDTQYGAGITATITSNSNNFTINSGSITVQVASDSPSYPVAAGASSVTVAKFTIYAAGEAVKVKFLDARLTVDDTDYATAAGVTDDWSNVRLIDDVGGQIGNSISTIAAGTSSGQCTLAASSATCHFGTTGSPINYIIPANTTRTISLVADSGSSTNIATVSGSLPAGMSNNLEGQMSFQAASSGSATGATRSVNSSPLVASLNAALVSPTYIAGSTAAKLASFILTASSAQAADVSSLTFDKDSNALFDMQNMMIKVGSTQFGTTRATIADAETSLSFSAATPITVPAGGSVQVDVFGDILSSTTSTTTVGVIDLTGWSAIGKTSGSAITMSPSAVEGQTLIVSAGPTLTLAIGSNTASAKNVVMGSTNNELFTVRLTSDNVDDLWASDFTISDTITSGATGVASFQNLTLWVGGEKVAGPLSMVMDGAASGTITFSLPGDGVLIEKNSSTEVTLRGDIPTFSSGGAQSGSSHVFKILIDTDLGVGTTAPGDTTVTVTGAPVVGNAIAVYRTKLGVTSATATGTHSRSSVDNVGTLVFSADSAYQATLTSVIIRFSGSAVGTSAAQTFTVDMIDTQTGVALTGATQQTCTPGAGSSCAVTFSPAYVISAGTSKNVIVRINSSNMPDTASVSEALSATILANTDLTWTDGTTAGINLETIQAPVVIANLTY